MPRMFLESDLWHYIKVHKSDLSIIFCNILRLIRYRSSLVLRYLTCIVPELCPYICIKCYAIWLCLNNVKILWGNLGSQYLVYILIMESTCQPDMNCVTWPYPHFHVLLTFIYLRQFFVIGTVSPLEPGYTIFGT
jgi:hypothetical protein